MTEILNISNRRISKLLSAKENICKVRNEIQCILKDSENLKKISISQVLNCAENIQLCLRAPNQWKPGHPLYFSHPPAPLPEEMRKGKLSEVNRKFQAEIVNHEALVAANIQHCIVTTSTLDAVKAPVKKIEQIEAKPTAIASNLNEDEVSDGLHLDKKRKLEIDEAAERKSRKLQISFGFSDSESDD